MKKIRLIVFCGILFAASNSLASEESQDAHAENIFKIDAAAQQQAGIQIITLEVQNLPKYINAPGEVIPDINLSTKITSRIPVQVLKRRVNIGDDVKTGQAIVTLSSVEMAKAQSDLLLAYNEWDRVKGLGQKAVSAKRYETAQITYEHAIAKLVAYGMTNEQVDSFLSDPATLSTTGEFTLLAPHDGVVYDANAVEGEVVEPGYALYHILDESFLSVDARLSNESAYLIKQGALTLISVADQWLKGEVVQIHHKLDEATRTQVVRVNVSNDHDLLHPGQFVTCRIFLDEERLVLAVPESAVLRTADDDWVVYAEVKPEYFQQIKVDLIEVLDKLAVIEGVQPGTRIVGEGAFSVQSEFLKSGFEVHGH